MKIKFASKKIKYDGSQLTSLFAYKNFNIQGDSAVAFIGPCNVAIDKMVDQADVKKKETIYSEKMLHFIVEKFELRLTEAVLRQRLYIAVVKELLEIKSGQVFIRKGDDLFFKNRKLTVSIATLSPLSSLIHIGINISSKNTPVTTSCLRELNIEPKKFAEEFLAKIKEEETEIINARSKVKGVA